MRLRGSLRHLGTLNTRCRSRHCSRENLYVPHAVDHALLFRHVFKTTIIAPKWSADGPSENVHWKKQFLSGKITPAYRLQEVCIKQSRLPDNACHTPPELTLPKSKNQQCMYSSKPLTCRVHRASCCVCLSSCICIIRMRVTSATDDGGKLHTHRGILPLAIVLDCTTPS